MLCKFSSCKALNTWSGVGLEGWGRDLAGMLTGNQLTTSLQFIHSFTSFSKHLWGLRSGPGPGMGSEDTINGALDTTPVLPELPVYGERQWKGIANTPRQIGQLRTLESTWHPECPVGARSCTQRFVQVLWLKFSHLSNGESPSDFFHRVVMRKERVFFVKHWE